MKTKINFHKIAYTGKQKERRWCWNRINEKECTNFEHYKGKYESIIYLWAIWDGVHYDCVSCGQNLDEIKTTVIGKNPKFLKIYELWKGII